MPIPAIVFPDAEGHTIGAPVMTWLPCIVPHVPHGPSTRQFPRISSQPIVPISVRAEAVEAQIETNDYAADRRVRSPGSVMRVEIAAWGLLRTSGLRVLEESVRQRLSVVRADLVKQSPSQDASRRFGSRDGECSRDEHSISRAAYRGHSQSEPVHRARARGPSSHAIRARQCGKQEPSAATTRVTVLPEVESIS